MQDASKLLPCPFCGRSPRHTYHGYSESWKVECSWDCPSKTSSTDKQLAIKAWNTRAALPGDAAVPTLPVEQSVGAEGNREAPYAASLDSAEASELDAAIAVFDNDDGLDVEDNIEQINAAIEVLLLAAKAYRSQLSNVTSAPDAQGDGENYEHMKDTIVPVHSHFISGQCKSGDVTTQQKGV